MQPGQEHNKSHINDNNYEMDMELRALGLREI